MLLKYPELFNPFKIGHIEMKNRIVMAPMDIIGWTDDKGAVTNEAIDYYEERAKGGVGLIISHANGIKVDFIKESEFSKSFRDPDHFIIQTKKLSERIHAYGAKLFFQIACDALGRIGAPGQDATASEIPNAWANSLMSRELTKEEIEDFIQGYIEAAVLCKRAGCDGVDVNGLYGGVLGDQFASSSINKRTDEYGGTLDGRIKIYTDIIKGIKEKCGKDFSVTIRLCLKQYLKAEMTAVVPGEEFIEYGRDLDESIAIGKKLEAAGYDALLIANGTYENAFQWLYPPMYQKDGLWLDTASKLKANVNIPVICPGKITTPKLANAAIENGMTDAVAIGRGLLADPEWANKAKTGNDEAIRPCIGCNNGCIKRVLDHMPVQCAVNGDLFKERNAKLEKVETPKKIAVIGGGISGMEAARIAAKRGHDVTIFEKNTKLGGVIIAGSVPEFKDADRRLLEWYDYEIVNAGVKVNYNMDMSLEKIEALEADEIVISTGATAKIPPIPGVNQEHVVTAIEILLGQKEAGENVTVIGGGQVGCETALWLQEKGKKVTIVEYLNTLMSGGTESLFVGNRVMLEDLLAFNKVEVLLNTKVASIGANTAIVITSDGEKTYAADTVILATGYASNSKLFNEVNSTLPKKVWLLGDAKAPSNILNAVKDGLAIGKVL